MRSAFIKAITPRAFEFPNKSLGIGNRLEIQAVAIAKDLLIAFSYLFSPLTDGTGSLLRVGALGLESRIEYLQIDKNGLLNQIGDLVATCAENRKQLKQVNETLFDLEKDATIGQLSRSIAHALNNAMVVLMGNMGIMRIIEEREMSQIARLLGAAMLITPNEEEFKGLIKDDIAQKLLEFADERNRSLDQLDKFIENVKALVEEILVSARHGIEPQPVSILKALKKIIFLAESVVLKTKTKFSYDYDGLTEEDIVMISPGGLLDVVLNLLMNAINACQEKENGEVKMNIRKELVNGKNSIIIEVSDNGKGISAEMSQVLLKQVVQSTKEGGHGVGLFANRKTIENAGGTITFVTTPGAGTEFTIILPLTIPTENPQ